MENETFRFSVGDTILRIEGQDLMKTWAEFFSHHTKEYNNYTFMFLFLGRDWFITRGFKASIITAEDINLWRKLKAKFFITGTGLIWRYNGMKEFSR